MERADGVVYRLASQSCPERLHGGGRFRPGKMIADKLHATAQTERSRSHRQLCASTVSPSQNHLHVDEGVNPEKQ